MSLGLNWPDQRSLTPGAMGDLFQAFAPSFLNFSSAFRISWPSLNKSHSTKSDSPATHLAANLPPSIQGAMFSISTDFGFKVKRLDTIFFPPIQKYSPLGAVRLTLMKMAGRVRTYFRLVVLQNSPG